MVMTMTTIAMIMMLIMIMTAGIQESPRGDEGLDDHQSHRFIPITFHHHCIIHITTTGHHALSSWVSSHIITAVQSSLHECRGELERARKEKASYKEFLVIHDDADAY